MAKKVQLVIDQGSNFSTEVILTDEDNGDLPIDLTGYSGIAEIRRTFRYANAISLSVSLGASNGSIMLSLAANATSNVAPGKYVFDAYLVNSANTPIRILEGIAFITPRVTRR